MNTPNSNIILGVTTNGSDAKTVYQTARLLGESVAEATVVRLDEYPQSGNVSRAVLDRIASMYLPETAKKVIIVAQEIAQEVISAIEDQFDATVITLDSRTSPEQVTDRITGAVAM